MTPDGELALVEVKDTGEKIQVAAHQLAAQLYTFGVLLRQGGDKLAEVINGMVEQRIACRLFPYDRPIPRVTRNEMVAVIAAPDKRSE